MIVLGSLVAMMTVATGVLRLFEPGPVAPLTGITLQSIEHEHSPVSRLFDTQAGRRDWRAIVVQDSGQLTGSARTLNHRHQQLGREGLGYHFIVNNGTRNQRDGAIEIGYRWQHQQPGDYLAASAEARWFHEHAIGVCVIGDADRRALTDAQLRELVWLVQALQRRYEIPASRVYVQVGGDREPLFPRGWFRDQLLAHRGP